MVVMDKRDAWLVACDIDGTLLLPETGNHGLEEFNRFIAERRDHVVFALNSGRSLADIASVADSGPIARPNWVITGVGTALWSDFSPESLDTGWDDEMNRPWQRAEIRESLMGCPCLREQEENHQHPARLSYYIDGPVSEVLPEVSWRTAQWEASVKRVVTLGYYLDFMPSWGGKGAPLVYLAERLGIAHDRVIAAGDSGNDRDMLDRDYPSIVVANHASDLDDIVGKPGVYLSREPGARGVLEGLRHFGLE